MIKSIQLKNFQSHKDTTLELSPGVNVIVGQSDTGKTAILRALRWIIENRPRGEEFRSHWGGTTEATIRLSDGTEVSRARSKSENAYYLNGVIFTALGNNVPEEIAKTINFSDINMQSQLDPPFLLSLSPGEVAASLNRMVNLEDIDTAHSNIARMIKSTTQDLKYEEDLLTKLSEDIKQYEYLDNAEVQLKTLVELAKTVSEAETLITLLSSLKSSITALQAQIHTVTVTVNKENELNTLLTKLKAREELDFRANELSELIAEIVTSEVSINKQNHIIQKEPELKTIIDKNEKYKTTLQQQEYLEDTLSEISFNRSKAVTCDAEIERLEKEWHKIAPKNCPLCGQVMPKEVKL